MRFGVLGPLAVWTADGSPVTVPGIKVRTLLAVLLAYAPYPVSTDWLLAELWGTELPGNPTGALQVEHGVAGVIDVGRFAWLLATARDCTDLQDQVTWLGEALALWRGEAYADIADSSAVRAAATRLEEQRITAVEDLAEARLALGGHSPLATELEELVTRHPLRERLRAAHLRALYLAGLHGEALDQFAQLRAQLREQLGTDPSPQLAQLHQAILVQDPGLEPSPPPAVTEAPTTNLPAAGTHEPELVGRVEDFAAVRE